MNARTTLLVDGVDLAALGFVQSRSADLWNGFTVADQLIELPGVVGAMLTSGDGRVPARDVTIEATILADSVAARLAAEDQLNALLFGRTVEVRQVDRLTRVRYGRVQSVSVEPAAPRYLARDSACQIKIIFPDPLAYTLGDLASPIAFGSTPVPIPMGSAACAPRVIITNTTAATINSRVLSVLTAGGDVVASMTLAGALLTGESLDVDYAEQIITKVTTAGVRSSARSWFTAGAWLKLRPSDGDPLRGLYPQLLLSTAETGVAFAPRVWF
jgi:hypothetical protein